VKGKQLPVRFSCLNQRRTNTEIAGEKRVRFHVSIFVPSSNKSGDVSFRKRDGTVYNRSPQFMRFYALKFFLGQSNTRCRHWRRRVNAFGEFRENARWEVPTFSARKRPVDRDQQSIVITSVEVETFNTNLMNKVARAKRSFPQDNIDA
jgi:hypothetical protein